MDIKRKFEESHIIHLKHDSSRVAYPATKK